MSINLEGKKCPVCQSYLFDEDDVVFCPICGAPHHRDCYAKIGHCGLEDLHGTQFEYGRAQEPEPKQENEEKAPGAPEVECLSCHTKYPVTLPKCPGCGMPNTLAGRMAALDYLGGVDRQEDLGEGVNAQQAAQFVMLSPNRYVPHFKAFKEGKKTWFNIWAFLFPTAWMSGRKMYLNGLFFALGELASALLMTPLANFMADQVGDGGYSAYMESLTRQEGLLTEVMHHAMPLYALAVGGLVLALIIRLAAGLFGERIYYRHMLLRCRQIEESDTEDDERLMLYRSKGGFNLFSFLAAVLAIQWLSALLPALFL